MEFCGATAIEEDKDWGKRQNENYARLRCISSKAKSLMGQ
jgi:hypothetical protein